MQTGLVESEPTFLRLSMTYHRSDTAATTSRLNGQNISCCTNGRLRSLNLLLQAFFAYLRTLFCCILRDASQHPKHEQSTSKQRAKNEGEPLLDGEALDSSITLRESALFKFHVLHLFELPPMKIKCLWLIKSYQNA